MNARYHDLVSLNHLNTIRHMLANPLIPQVAPSPLTLLKNLSKLLIYKPNKDYY